MSRVNSKSLALAELNVRSAPLASFDVGIFHPRIDDYEYNDKRSGTTKKGETFRCLLVSAEDPQHYVAAEMSMRGQNRDPLVQAMNKYKAGLLFRMSKTALKTNAKQEYIHTPLKMIVDMIGTKFDSILQGTVGDGTHLAPQPAMTVGGSKTLKTSQRFNITALVVSVSEPRPGGPQRKVRNVLLIQLVEMKLR